MSGPSSHNSHEGMAHPGMPHSPADQNHAEHHGREAHQGHDQHSGHSVAMFRDKFWGSVAGAILMSFSTVVVALNAQLLRRVNL